MTCEEGNTVAEQHGSLYCETSALLAEGVTECFNQAVSKQGQDQTSTGSHAGNERGFQ